jgi:hypothetical protein
MQAEVKELVEIRRRIAHIEQVAENELTPLKQLRDALQARITEELKNAGVLSQRFHNAGDNAPLALPDPQPSWFPRRASQAGIRGKLGRFARLVSSAM